MQTFNNISNFIFGLLTKYLQLVLVTILWAICSIPILTFGASTSALYYMSNRIIKENDGRLVLGFFEAFQNNFKKGTALTAIYLVLFAVLYIDFAVCFQLPGGIAPTLLAFAAVVGMMSGMMANAAFALLSMYENKVLEYLKNAFFFTFAKFGYVFLGFALNMVPVLVFVFFTSCFIANLPAWLLVAMPISLWINTLLFNKAASSFRVNNCEG